MRAILGQAPQDVVGRAAGHAPVTARRACRGVPTMRLAAILALLALPVAAAGGATADPAGDVAAAARAAWPGMPALREVPRIAGACGADGSVSAAAAYCTTTGEVLIATHSRAAPGAAYLVAHLMGHGAHVTQGVADRALSAIRRSPGDEAALRARVERQVDCLAGVLAARAGQPAPPGALFDADPFPGPHWGRDPLRAGPRMALPLAERGAAFARGAAAGHPRACADPELDGGLLEARWRLGG